MADSLFYGCENPRRYRQTNYPFHCNWGM